MADRLDFSKNRVINDKPAKEKHNKNHNYTFTDVLLMSNSSSATLLIGLQERHPTSKNLLREIIRDLA